ncbi:MAG: FmdB family transcriptional regulator [Phycisphaerae bacterium]|nr:FmdB family transcriptional regulator [Phycisphaerae bacterium]|tara:strand:- start:267 stop:488 length:222 start_codon:yes stop_codon:yes gene_type:complete
MPLYEYRCEEDGDLITLLRPMAEADEPVDDPDGLNRSFHRVHSVFTVEAPVPPRMAECATPPPGGCCGGGCHH